MFRRKNNVHGTKARNKKIQKAVKRLLEKPNLERLSVVADLAGEENTDVSGVSHTPMSSQ